MRRAQPGAGLGVEAQQTAAGKGEGTETVRQLCYGSGSHGCEGSESEPLRTGGRLHFPARADVVAESAGGWRQSSFLPGQGRFSCLRPSTDWTRPTHATGGDLLSSGFTD